MSTPSTNPTTRLPASPMKIDAGGKLKQRNPSSAPSSSASDPATNHCPMLSAAARKAVVQTAATPALRPSMLSRKLKALVMAAIQRTVRKTDGTVPKAVRMRSDLNDTTRAVVTASWTMSFE